MKRSPALAPLSREHQHALDLALRLRRATDADAAEVAERAARFWREESSQHFAQEEQVLLPALARHAGDEDADIGRVKTEHDDLRRRFTGAAAVTAELHELGRRLNDHVRFEERELFPRIESLLSEPELADVGARLG